MPVKRQTTNIDIKRLRELARAGVTRAEAARETGMSKDAVCYWDRKLGLGFALTKRSPRPTTAMDLARLQALAADGDAPLCAVARALGMSKSSVSFWGRRFGLSFPGSSSGFGHARIGVIPDSAIQRAVLVR